MSATLPTTLSDSLPTPQPQRTTNDYQSQAVPDAQIQAGQQTVQDARATQDREDRNAILDAQSRSNDAKAKTMAILYGDDTNPGLFAARGQQAMGSEDAYNKQFADIQTQAMDGVTNIQAQKALKMDLENLNLSNVDNVKRFEQEQRRGYTVDLAGAQNALDSQRAGLEPNNQATIDQLVASAKQTGITNAKLKGAVPGDTIWNGEITNATSNVLSQQLDAMSRSKDPSVLMQFNTKYEQYRQSGNLTLDAVDKFDKVKELISPTIDAMKQRADDNHNQLTYQVPDDKIVSAIGKVESGGNDAAVSPKGASGAMGIMPDTALALAGGDQTKANQILSNPDANKAAGAQYFQQMKGQFGDTRMALMAYNAGPTVVSDWMNGTNNSGKNDSKLRLGDPSKGQVTVDQFIAQVPFAETRAYPGKVLGAAGFSGSIGPMDMSLAQDKAAKMQPEAAKTYLEMVTRDNAAYAAQADQARKSTMDTAFQYMADQGAGYRTMPVGLQSQIDAAGLTQQIKNYNPTAPSDQATLMYLMGLPPKKLAETDLNTPDIRMSLSPVDYSKWKQKQTQMSSPAAQVTESYMQNVLRNGFARRGISTRTHFDPDTGEAITDGGEDFIRAHDLLNTSIDAYSQENDGRMPDGAAIQKMGDGIFTKILVPGKLWGTNPGNKYDIKIDDIQALDKGITKAKISDELVRRGISPTDQNIIATYVSRVKVAPSE